MVWEQLSDAAGTGEYSGVVSLGVCLADEVASDGGLSAVGICPESGSILTCQGGLNGTRRERVATS
jgi:hypothetical protein